MNEGDSAWAHEPWKRGATAADPTYLFLQHMGLAVQGRTARTVGIARSRFHRSPLGGAFASFAQEAASHA